MSTAPSIEKTGWTAPAGDHVVLYEDALKVERALTAERDSLRAELAEMKTMHDGNLKLIADQRKKIDALRLSIVGTNAELAEARKDSERLRGVLDGYRGQVDRFGNSPAADALAAKGAE